MVKPRILPEDKEKYIQRILDNTDWGNYWARVHHALQEPTCSCTSCYERWLNNGRALYENDVRAYDGLVKEAHFNLHQKQLLQKMRTAEMEERRMRATELESSFALAA